MNPRRTSEGHTGQVSGLNQGVCEGSMDLGHLGSPKVIRGHQGSPWAIRDNKGSLRVTRGRSAIVNLHEYQESRRARINHWDLIAAEHNHCVPYEHVNSINKLNMDKQCSSQSATGGVYGGYGGYCS